MSSIVLLVHLYQSGCAKMSSAEIKETQEPSTAVPGLPAAAVPRGLAVVVASVC